MFFRMEDKVVVGRIKAHWNDKKGKSYSPRDTMMSSAVFLCYLTFNSTGSKSQVNELAVLATIVVSN